MLTAQSASELPASPPAFTSIRPRRIAILASFALSTLFYVWTLVSTGATFNFGAAQRDPYNLLTDGFLHGHLSLALQPPAGLLHLQDPYSPAQNAPYNASYHDLLLYHGHFYLFWGPTPVLTLFAPWRLLHLGAAPAPFALLVFAVVGLGFALLTLGFLVERFIPNARTWQVVVAAFAIATCNVVPFLLRSPLTYEVNIAGSYCFAMIGLYLVAIGIFGSRDRPIVLAGASLGFGLAAGGREDDLLLGVVLVAALVFWARTHREVSRRARAQTALALVAPFALCVLLIALYNEARFGSLTQFGGIYQLASDDPQTTPFYQFGYLAPSLYFNLIAPVRWSLGFPFFVLPPPPAYPGALPPSWSPEVLAGVFLTTPLTILLLAAPWLRRRRILNDVLYWIAIVLAATAGLILLATAFSVPGTTMRYQADFAPLVVLAAVLIWLGATRATRGLRRWTLHGFGALVALYGVAVGVAVSTVGYYDIYPRSYSEVETTSSGVYWALDELTSPLPTLATMIVGHPVITKVTSPGGVTSKVNYTTLGVGTGVFLFLAPQPAEIEVISPSSGNWYLEAGLNTLSGSSSHPTIEMHLAANGTVRTFPFAPEIVNMPIRLHLGLNRIQLSATDQAETSSGTALAQVYGLLLLRSPMGPIVRG